MAGVGGKYMGTSHMGSSHGGSSMSDSGHGGDYMHEGGGAARKLATKAIAEALGHQDADLEALETAISAFIETY